MQHSHIGAHIGAHIMGMRDPREILDALDIMRFIGIVPASDPN
jgi:hypothetical protein